MAHSDDSLDNEDLGSYLYTCFQSGRHSDVTLEVTDEHIYGSGGASLCYQFDIAAYDVAFGIWLKRTGADVLTHGEEVVLISEKYESVRTTPPPPDLLAF